MEGKDTADEPEEELRFEGRDDTGREEYPGERVAEFVGGGSEEGSRLWCVGGGEGEEATVFIESLSRTDIFRFLEGAIESVAM